MSEQESSQRAERQRVREVREGVLEGVGTLILSMLCGVAVFFGLGAWFLVANAFHSMGVIELVAFLLAGAVLVTGGGYGFYKL